MADLKAPTEAEIAEIRVRADFVEDRALKVGWNYAALEDAALGSNHT